jgi:thiamine biosynthesis lipoprotein
MSENAQPRHGVRRLKPLLGTFVEIWADGQGAAMHAALDAAFAAVARVQGLMSYHAARSDVSRINRAASGERVQIDQETWRVLRFAERLRRLSAGAFDVAVGGSLVASGALPASAAEGREAAVRGELELLDEGAVRWHRRGLIDLGGVAKGYAVDRAIQALRACGAACALVNAGGDLRCYGRAQPVYVRAPDGPLVRLGHLCEGALATSGDSAPPAALALVDPASGRPLRWEASVSVVAKDCMSADALTKVVRLCPARAPALLARLAAQAFCVNCDGSVQMSAAGAPQRRRLQ